MIEVILTKGLPASGKTTWAKEIIGKNPNKYKRINKDELRAMLDNSKHSNDSEKFVLQVRDALILMAIERGKHIIVDDTNLAPKHEARIRELIKGKAKLVIEDFTHVPLETCIERDLKRNASVGQKVILGMHKQFINPQLEYTQNENLPKGIIVDIDGTLAKMNGRSPYEWHKVGEDSCNPVVKGLVNAYLDTVFIFSGRDGVCLPETIKWLDENKIIYEHLCMREEGNTEKDTVIKRKMFDQHNKGKYFIEYVLDDRNQVVEMWRNMGLTCLQVADGDF